MVYVSSIFAFFNCLNMGAYSVSKRGLEAFADCLRVEMASFGVKVQMLENHSKIPATLMKRNIRGDVQQIMKDACRETGRKQALKMF